MAVASKRGRPSSSCARLMAAEAHLDPAHGGDRQNHRGRRRERRPHEGPLGIECERAAGNGRRDGDDQHPGAARPGSCRRHLRWQPEE
eukprot:4112769-Alexandrium_andersonii.AAC.1